MKEFIRVMKALSDPSRVKIMKLLEIKEFCVCEITGVLGLAQSTVSKHLKILEDAGFVDSRKNGAWVNYTLAENPDTNYAASLQANLKKWLKDDPAVCEALLLADKVDRLSLCEANETARLING